jgi:hypothetical protein
MKLFRAGSSLDTAFQPCGVEATHTPNLFGNVNTTTSQFVLELMLK